MIVYIVTTYRDGERRVKAVFEDRDQAIYCCALCDQKDAEIEEHDTEAIKISGNKKPLAEWTVYVNPDGEVIDTSVRYTFEPQCKYSEDVDGSWVACLTQDVSVSEDQVKEIVLDHIDQQTR